MVLRELWPKLLRDLLEFESSLVFGSGHIGLVNMPFNFRVTDPRPIRENRHSASKGGVGVAAAVL